MADTHCDSDGIVLGRVNGHTAAISAESNREWLHNVVNVHNDPKSGRAGPQGTTLFRPDELAEVIASPSADLEGDVARAALVGITPPFLDQRFVLKRSKTLIGRRDDNHVVLPDNSVSAQHAWILHENGHYRLMNMLSTNGTYVNDAKMHEGPLEDGDRIRFGRAEFIFHTGVAPVAKPVAVGVPAWVWMSAAAVLVIAVGALLAF
jgi:hypothetical protein